MRVFVLTAIYELHVSRKNHLRDHPTSRTVRTEEETLICLKTGAFNRTTASTNMNDQGSNNSPPTPLSRFKYYKTWAKNIIFFKSDENEHSSFFCLFVRRKSTVLRIRIRYAFLDPGIQDRKINHILDPESAMNIPDHISKELSTGTR